eukprot:403375144
MSSSITNPLGRDSKDQSNVLQKQVPQTEQNKELTGKTLSQATTGQSFGLSQKISDPTHSGSALDNQLRLEQHSGIQPGSKQDQDIKHLQTRAGNLTAKDQGIDDVLTQGVQYSGDISSMSEADRMKHLQDIQNKQRLGGQKGSDIIDK